MPWTGLDLDGHPVTADDPATVRALVAARNERARPARLDAGRDPEPGRPVVVWPDQAGPRRTSGPWGGRPDPGPGTAA
jgi:hypothetical protein